MITTIAEFVALALALATAPGAFASEIGMGRMGMTGAAIMRNGFSLAGVPEDSAIVFSGDGRRLITDSAISATSTIDSVSATVMPYLVDERGTVVIDSGAASNAAITRSGFDGADGAARAF